MSRWDYFGGASERWRADARARARRVQAEHSDDPLAYVQKRIDRSAFGTFERRRWTYIRKLLIKYAQEQEQQRAPLSQA